MGGVRRSPNVTPDVVIGKGEDEVGAEGVMAGARITLAAVTAPIQCIPQTTVCSMRTFSHPSELHGPVPVLAAPTHHLPGRLCQ